MHFGNTVEHNHDDAEDDRDHQCDVEELATFSVRIKYNIV